MAAKKKETKQMIFTFRKDGSMVCVYDDAIKAEPFMPLTYYTIKGLADTWFEHVKELKDINRKVKSFEIIIKI